MAGGSYFYSADIKYIKSMGQRPNDFLLDGGKYKTLGGYGQQRFGGASVNLLRAFDSTSKGLAFLHFVSLSFISLLASLPVP